MPSSARLAGALFFSALTGLLLSLAGLSGYEAWALRKGQLIITDRTSRAIRQHPNWALAATLAALGLGAHFWYAAVVEKEQG